jgi:hypothetical protein
MGFPMPDEPAPAPAQQAGPPEPKGPPTMEHLKGGPPAEPPGQSIDPPQKASHKPTEQELDKMKAHRPEPFTVEADEGMPAGFKLMRYHSTPPWSWINPDGSKHTVSYDSKEEAIAAAKAL